MSTVRQPDIHGNRHAREGVTQCWCGCCYWENDRCVDCNARADALDCPECGVDCMDGRRAHASRCSFYERKAR